MSRYQSRGKPSPRVLALALSSEQTYVYVISVWVFESSLHAHVVRARRDEGAGGAGNTRGHGVHHVGLDVRGHEGGGGRHLTVVAAQQAVVVVRLHVGQGVRRRCRGRGSRRRPTQQPSRFVQAAEEVTLQIKATIACVVANEWNTW